MKNIKVSVIVLTYNHEKYIEQALDSILMQKVSFNYEILVGDDASTDATVPILLKYKKKYPKVKNFDDVIDISDTEGAAQAAEAMMVLIIPVEKARRSIAAGYYGLNNN